MADLTASDIISLADCPKCGAMKGSPCVLHGKARKQSHVERLYLAQDMKDGRPPRVVPDRKKRLHHTDDRHCPVCGKRLRSRLGVGRHMHDVHAKDGALGEWENRS